MSPFVVANASPLLTRLRVTVHILTMRVTGHTRLATAARRRQPPRGGRARTASIRDVASAAGVSYQTVSRVINGSTKVNPSTRQQVLQAIEQLDFRPNRAARALAGGPVQSVTVLTSKTT